MHYRKEPQEGAKAASGTVEEGTGSSHLPAGRDLEYGKWSGAMPTEAMLMFQFVSHRIQQQRHTKGLVKGPPGSEQFRDIQDVCFPADA